MPASRVPGEVLQGRRDKALYCTDYKYHGFNIDMNSHYLYYPRKVVIEDVTYDPLAQAYRWKFAWRFNDCEMDWLKQMCQYGQCAQFALVLSDPTWYGYAVLDGCLKRDLLAVDGPQHLGQRLAGGQRAVRHDLLPLPAAGLRGQLPADGAGGLGAARAAAGQPHAGRRAAAGAQARGAATSRPRRKSPRK